MTENITHTHLRHHLANFTLTDELSDLIMELQYSTLIVPKTILNEYSAVRNTRVPLFTDMHEYKKSWEFKDVSPAVHDFNFYLEFLKGEDFPGFVINPESESFHIGSEFLEIMKPNYVFEIEMTPFTISEILKIKRSINGNGIKEYLGENLFINPYEIVEILGKEDSLTLLKSDENHDGDIISPHNIPMYHHKSGRERYALIFTSDSEIDVSSKDNFYSQIVNLPLLFEHVLKCDLDGAIINLNSDKITLSRDFIRSYMLDFSCPWSDDYAQYAFAIK